MRSIRAATILLLLALSSDAEDRGDRPQFHLIAHPSVRVRTISRHGVAEIFLKRETTWPDGTLVLPVDQPIRSKVRERFIRRIYGKDARFIARYWHRKIFSGRGHPPPEMASEDEVIAYVQKHAGAIGYVSTGRKLENVQVVEVTP